MNRLIFIAMACWAMFQCSSGLAMPTIPKGCEKTASGLTPPIYDSATRVLCINGVIDSSTLYAFEEDMAPRNIDGIILNSNGGSKLGGEEVAKYIRERGYPVYVPANFKCLSSCVWLFASARKRYAHPKAEIGLHYGYEDVNASKVKVLLEESYEYLTAVSEYSGVDMRSRYYAWAEAQGLTEEIKKSKGGIVDRSFVERSFWIPSIAGLFELGFVTDLL